MILTCPSCGTQYVVKDGAIPAQGRQVRCAACKHSWHQDPGDMPAEEEAPAYEPETAEAAPGHEEAAYHEEAPEEVMAEERGEPNYEAAAEETEAPAETDEEDESLTEATLIEPRGGPEAEQRAYEEAMLEDAPAATAAEEPVA